MTNSENLLANLKHQLRQKRENQEKEVVWKLNDEQKEYVEQLGYGVIPWIYEINTKPIPGVKYARAKIIRDVHYANQRKRKKLYRTLKPKEVKALQEHEVRYHVLKYKIILQ